MHSNVTSSPERKLSEWETDQMRKGRLLVIIYWLITSLNEQNMQYICLYIIALCHIIGRNIMLLSLIVGNANIE